MLQHLKPLVKDSAVYALGNISGKVAGFILLPFYVDKLTVDEYGMLGTLEATFQLILSLASLNLYSAFIRWYSDRELLGRRESTFFTWLVTIAAIAILLIICVIPSSPAISRLLFDSDGYTRPVKLMICSAGLELVGTVPATLCRMQSRSVQYARSIMVKLGVVLVLTILFLAVFDRRLEGIYEAQVIGGAVYLVLFLPYIVRNVKVRFETGILKRMFHYSLPLFMSSSFGVLLGFADRFSLTFISGLASVGVYSLGFKLANSLKTIIVQPVNLALTPVMFRMVDKPDAKRFYSKMMTYLTFGLTFCAVGVSMFGQEAVKLLTAKEPDYWGAYAVIPFIAFGIVCGVMKDQTTYSLQIAKRTGIIASVIAFVSVLNLGLNILFINMTGTIGAALSNLLAQTAYFSIMLYYAQRYCPVPYEFKKLFCAVGTGIAFCVAAYLIRDCSLALRLGIKTVLLVFYPFALYLFRCYDKKELQALHGFWKKWKNPAMQKAYTQK